MKYEEPRTEKGREPEILIVAVDCGAYAVRNADKFAQLRDIATRITRHRLIYGEGNDDLVGVFKVGSKVTKNRLATDNPGGYAGIELVFAADRRCLASVRAVRDLQADGKSVILLDVLEALGDYLSTFEGAGAKRMRIVLFTHSKSIAHDPENEVVAELIATCDLYRDALVQLDVVCADLNESPDIDDEDDLEEEEEEETQGNGAEKVRPSSYFFQRAKEHGIPVLWAVARATGGMLLSGEEASEEVDRPITQSKRPVARFRGTLDIGRDVQIPIKMYRAVLQTGKDSAQKISWAASRAQSKVVGVSMETICVATAMDDIPLEKEQLIDAYTYGTDLVPVQRESVDEEWSYKAACGISTIAFISCEKVPWRWFMSTVDAVIPMPGVPQARSAMHALVQALHDDDKGILARVVTRQSGGAPVMAFLWPAIETMRGGEKVKHRFLYMNELPLREDVRDYPFASLQKVGESLSEDAENAMDAFIDCRRLDAMNEGDVPELNSAELCNPVVDRFFCAVAQRALDGPDGNTMPPLSKWQRDLLDPATFVPSSKVEQVDKTLKTLKVSLPVTRVPVKERYKKKVAEALSGESASLSDFLPPETGELDEGEEAQPSAADVQEGTAYLLGGHEW